MKLSPSRQTLMALLEEVDPDIKEMMLRPSGEMDYLVMDMYTDPGNFILGWQAMRDRKEENRRRHTLDILGKK